MTKDKKTGDDKGAEGAGGKAGRTDSGDSAKIKKQGREISAGGIVYRPKEGGGVEIALISTREGKRWGLPKGLVEEGENLARTAHREVKEETGLDGRIIKNLGHVEYFYTFTDDAGPRRIFKIVYFFLMEYTAGDTADHDDEVVECAWFELGDVRTALSFDDERGIIDRAEAELKELAIL